MVLPERASEVDFQKKSMGVSFFRNFLRHRPDNLWTPRVSAEQNLRQKKMMTNLKSRPRRAGSSAALPAHLGAGLPGGNDEEDSENAARISAAEALAIFTEHAAPCRPPLARVQPRPLGRGPASALQRAVLAGVPVAAAGAACHHMVRPEQTAGAAFAGHVTTAAAACCTAFPLNGSAAEPKHPIACAHAAASQRRRHRGQHREPLPPHPPRGYRQPLSAGRFPPRHVTVTPCM